LIRSGKTVAKKFKKLFGRKNPNQDAQSSVPGWFQAGVALMLLDASADELATLSNEEFQDVFMQLSSSK
jgi:hypothetical protein